MGTHIPIPTNTSATTEFSATPQEFGIGARVTLAVMSDDYVAVILEALQEADSTGIEIQTGVVSTYLSGPEPDLLRYISQVIAGASRTGAHVTATVQFSRGCPGEVTCTLPPGGGLFAEIPTLAPTGVQAVAEWALYPLDDGAGSGSADHMRDIYAAIESAKASGLLVHSEHFVTRLEGDLALVLQVIAAGWIMAGRTVQHVATHATISLNSPSLVSNAR
jgi:uncharacterized protein YqgV (UPF0045/DUF77 family)